jgi:soluble lytic murein transglycosylase-like protein
MKRQVIVAVIAFILAALLLIRSTKERIRMPLKPKTPEEIRQVYGSIVDFVSSVYGVPREKIYSHIYVESKGDETATGQVGERGLMQILPIALEDVKQYYILPYSFNDLYDARANIEVGTAFLAVLKRRWGSWEAASQAFNAGSPGKKKGLAYLELIRSAQSLFT